MPYQPQVNDELLIDGISYRLAEHPAAPGMPYGQEGRTAVVYRLTASSGDKSALKVFKPRCRLPALVGLADKLAPFADLPGLAVCRRAVLTPRRHSALLRQHLDLTYAVLMPWIEGPTWMETMLEKWALTAEQSLAMARSLTEVLEVMEEHSLAHCDLSGPNVLLPGLLSSHSQSGESEHDGAVVLVDVEQMYSPDLSRPEVLPGGSAGYAHRTAPEGLWSVDADRFAGAMILAEMLGWCDDQVRNASWGETYFDPGGLQEETERYRRLASVLRGRWGERVSELFERAWRSETVTDCATFGEWLIAIPETVPTGPSLPPLDLSGGKPDASDNAVRSLMDLARQFEKQGKISEALETYRHAQSRPETGSGSRQEIEFLVRDLEMRQRATVPPGGVQELPTTKWKPPLPQTSRASMAWVLLAVFAGLGMALYLFIRATGNTIDILTRQSTLVIGYMGTWSASTGLLAMLVGCVEVLLFRQRMRGSQRWLFIITTVLGGALGGMAGHSAVSTGLITSSLGVGAVIGCVASSIASLGQNLFMRARQMALKWFIWNTVGWTVIWGIGWTISWGIGGTGGVAAAGAFMMVATGVVLSLFLYSSPEFEF